MKVQGLGFVVRRTNQKRRKFESRDKWLGIRDWGLAVTGDWDSPASSSRAQPSISTALRESACMRLGKMMSWCCLTSGNERSAIEISRLRSK